MDWNSGAVAPIGFWGDDTIHFDLYSLFKKFEIPSRQPKKTRDFLQRPKNDYDFSIS